MSQFTPTQLQKNLFRLGLSRIQLCFQTGISRYRLYLFEKGMITLKPEEVDILRDKLTKFPPEAKSEN
jgi:hypothetical protein